MRNAQIISTFFDHPKNIDIAAGTYVQHTTYHQKLLARPRSPSPNTHLYTMLYRVEYTTTYYLPLHHYMSSLLFYVFLYVFFWITTIYGPGTALLPLNTVLLPHFITSLYPTCFISSTTSIYIFYFLFFESTLMCFKTLFYFKSHHNSQFEIKHDRFKRIW